MPGHTQTQAEWEQAMARRAMELTRSELYLQMRYMNAALGALALQPDPDPGRGLATDGASLVYGADWVLRIYREGVNYAVLMATRVVALIAGTSLLTYTTSPIVLTDAIESLLRPLQKLHFPVHELAMMMTIALRFIPTLIDETEKIMNAQKARGAKLDNGKFTERIQALIPILIPLFISAFRRADELAMAMECRCYHGGEGRTRLKVLRFGKLDVLCTLALVAMLAAILATKLLF